MQKHIIIVTPKFPYPTTGACEQDRFMGIKDFLRYGYSVTVITKVRTEERGVEAVEKGRELGVKVFPVMYKHQQSTIGKRLKRIFFRIIQPWYLDGAAYEYADKEIQDILKKEIARARPDFVVFDYSYLWSLYSIVKKEGIPIITRSINFEPLHFLDEDGRSLINYIKTIPKLLSELITIKKSSLIFSISPKEREIYKKLGRTKVLNLPLRSLPTLLKGNRDIRDKDVLHLYFTGSTYNVQHNRDALELLIREIAPELHRRFPNKFLLHILGSKLPDQLKNTFGENVIYEGFVENLVEFIEDMDIAVVPSLFGAGMQQKIFEPLALGVPTVASSRGIAGYPFEHNNDILLVDSVDCFVEQIARLRDVDLRKKLSANAMKVSHTIFSQKSIDSIVHKGIEYV